MVSHQVAVLTVYQVSELLQISLNQAHTIMDSTTLPILVIGNCKRVLKDDLYNWLCENETIN